jgi:hypothetical protein
MRRIVDFPCFIPTCRTFIILMAITSQIKTPVSFGEVIMKTEKKIAVLFKATVIKPVVFTIEKICLEKHWAD